MEKFGIFELLDALAALTAQETAREEKPSAQDLIYQAPVYGKASATETQPEQKSQSALPAQSPHAEQDALAEFYARHDAVAKKAGKK